MKKLLSILFLIISIPLFAHHYYVKNGGNNSNTGLSDAQAWETIAKINGFTFAANDTISFKCGSLWREQLIIPRNNLLFTNYGAGAKPIITTSKNESLAGDWTNLGSNIWVDKDASFTGTNFDVGNLIFNDDSIGYNRLLKSRMNDTIGEFYYSISGDSLYIYCTSNPATYYGDIECATSKTVINGNGESYITIDGIDIKWSGRLGINWSTSANFITIQNCDFEWCGGSRDNDGLAVQVGNAIQFYASSYTDVVVKNCRFYQVLDASISPQAPTAGQYIKRHYYYNNLFINVRYALEFNWKNDGTADTIFFNNNTCYRDDNYLFTPDNRWEATGWQSAFSTFYQIFNVANHFIKSYNNIFYYESHVGMQTAGTRYNFYPCPASLDIDYNLYYSPDAFTDTHALGNSSGTPKYTLATWQSVSGTPDIHGYNSNPLFINTTSPMEFDSLMIPIGSPVIDLAIGLGAYTIYDCRNSLRDASPDIGAFEYRATSVHSIVKTGGKYLKYQGKTLILH